MRDTREGETGITAFADYESEIIRHELVSASRSSILVLVLILATWNLHLATNFLLFQPLTTNL